MMIVPRLLRIAALFLLLMGSIGHGAWAAEGRHGGGHGGSRGDRGHFAHDGFERGFIGFGVGLGYPYWADPYWSDPYYYAPPVYYPAVQPVMVVPPPMPPVSPQGTTYAPVPAGAPINAPRSEYFFCPQNKGIYPQVKTCPGAWQRLPLVPPGVVQ